MRKLKLKCLPVVNYYLVFPEEPGTGLLHAAGFTVEEAYKEFFRLNTAGGNFGRARLSLPNGAMLHEFALRIFPSLLK